MGFGATVNEKNQWARITPCAADRMDQDRIQFQAITSLVGDSLLLAERTIGQDRIGIRQALWLSAFL